MKEPIKEQMKEPMKEAVKESMKEPIKETMKEQKGALNKVITTLANAGYFDAISEIHADEIQDALVFAKDQILTYLPEFTHHYQNAYSVDLFYEAIDNTYWTTGFWTGEIWLAYEFCKDIALKEAGDIQVKSFLDRINQKIEVDHHDMGFLYSPSCVAAYKLHKNPEGREAAIKAADQLLTRFQPVGEFLQAWGPMNAPENYRLIIDCLLNLPLLYWAYEETGVEKYKTIAEKHIHTAVAHVIREDYSTWHTYFFNMETGEGDHGETCQGYKNDSAWARGQAWGIYGCAIAYRYTKEDTYLDLFRKVTGYFLEHLPKDLIPYWDLTFGEGSTEPRDSSSASIAACGMLEMARFMEDEERDAYIQIAKKLMGSLVRDYAVKEHAKSNGLVMHSTYSNHSPYNTCNHYGVDECNSWGDYFYMEALTRLSKTWEPYW